MCATKRTFSFFLRLRQVTFTLVFIALSSASALAASEHVLTTLSVSIVIIIYTALKSKKRGTLTNSKDGASNSYFYS